MAINLTPAQTWWINAPFQTLLNKYEISSTMLKEKPYIGLDLTFNTAIDVDNFIQDVNKTFPNQFILTPLSLGGKSGIYIYKKTTNPTGSKPNCTNLVTKYKEFKEGVGNEPDLKDVTIKWIVEGESFKLSDPKKTSLNIQNILSNTGSYEKNINEDSGVDKVYLFVHKDGSLVLTCKKPSVETDPVATKAQVSGSGKDISITPEQEVAKVKENLCVPILKEYWGVKFNFAEGGEDKMWALSLAPAVKSQANNSVPNAMPGIRIQASTKFAKKEIAGWHSIYQPMGVDTVYITMVGAFTGDGGYRGNANYQPGTFEGRDNPKFKIDPTTNPNFNVGNRLISGVQEFNDNASVAKLIDNIGVENAVMANFVNREGMFDRVGCDSDCPPVYRGLFGGDAKDSSGKATNPIKYPDFYIGNPGAPGTYTRQELNAYLDAYHEFDDFMRLAVIQGREMDVEINMRKSLDSLRPFDKKWQPNENTLRNATTGNIAFKGVVRTMDVYAARANRVWYTIVMEVTDLGISDIASVGADWGYRIYSEEEIEALSSPEAVLAAEKNLCADMLIEAMSLIRLDPDVEGFIGNILVKEELVVSKVNDSTIEVVLRNKKSEESNTGLGVDLAVGGAAISSPITIPLILGAISKFMGSILSKIRLSSLSNAAKSFSGFIAKFPIKNPWAIIIAMIVIAVTFIIIYAVEGLNLPFFGVQQRLINQTRLTLEKELNEKMNEANLTYSMDIRNRKFTVTCKNL
jgi:hypothetical protein